MAIDRELHDSLGSLSSYVLAQDSYALAQDSYALKRALSQSQGNVSSLQAGTPTQPPYSQAAINSAANDVANKLLRQRFAGVQDTFKLGQKDFLLAHFAEAYVYTFFVLNGKEGVVKEPTDIFPSDKLITQLRMIKET